MDAAILRSSSISFEYFLFNCKMSGFSRLTSCLDIYARKQEYGAILYMICIILINTSVVYVFKIKTDLFCSSQDAKHDFQGEP